MSALELGFLNNHLNTIATPVTSEDKIVAIAHFVLEAYGFRCLGNGAEVNVLPHLSSVWAYRKIN